MVVYTVFWPYARTTEQLSGVVFTKLGVNLIDCAQISYSLEVANKNPMLLFLIASKLLMMSSHIGIITYSAIKIKNALKSPILNRVPHFASVCTLYGYDNLYAYRHRNVERNCILEYRSYTLNALCLHKTSNFTLFSKRRCRRPVVMHRMQY
ncbi:unnamed protein product [Cylicocyclus nassatus]|uniref:Uncharacterized protein n=1 Tax=Cylicocyclus nassatus TaxID=53992 RepID=A0AA36GU87_CYLNA|nr:unnamed protein product [Cylicocyclus nassatus]